MSVVIDIFFAVLALGFPVVAYLWYVTPNPQDLANEVLCRKTRKIRNNGSGYASRPQSSMTHINCLS